MDPGRRQKVAQQLRLSAGVNPPWSYNCQVIISAECRDILSDVKAGRGPHKKSLHRVGTAQWWSGVRDMTGRKSQGWPIVEGDRGHKQNRAVPVPSRTNCAVTERCLNGNRTVTGRLENSGCHLTVSFKMRRASGDTGRHCAGNWNLDDPSTVAALNLQRI
jgi:hypothetical protein